MNIFARLSFKWVGTVEGRTEYTREDGTVSSETRGYWVLTENGFGQRRAKKIGSAGDSPFANDMEAQVKAWVFGGPIPPLDKAPPAKITPKKIEKPTLKIVPFKAADK